MVNGNAYPPWGCYREQEAPCQCRAAPKHERGARGGYGHGRGGGRRRGEEYDDDDEDSCAPAPPSLPARADHRPDPFAPSHYLSAAARTAPLLDAAAARRALVSPEDEEVSPHAQEYRAMDKDGNGDLTADEMAAQWGKEGRDYQKRVDWADADGDGKVSEEEWVAATSAKREGGKGGPGGKGGSGGKGGPGGGRGEFVDADTDGDHSLSKDEMAAAWGMDDATAGKKLDALDTDGDGSVSPDEFFEKGKGPRRDGPGSKGRGGPGGEFAEADADRDHSLSAEEMAAHWGIDAATAAEKVNDLDHNQDGSVSPDEYYGRAGGKSGGRGGRGGWGEEEEDEAEPELTTGSSAALATEGGADDEYVPAWSLAVVATLSALFLCAALVLTAMYVAARRRRVNGTMRPAVTPHAIAAAEIRADHAVQLGAMGGAVVSPLTMGDAYELPQTAKPAHSVQADVVVQPLPYAEVDPHA